MIRQAIETKYLGPTNTRGARVKASAQAGSVTISWDDALEVNENHEACARALATKLGWTGMWVAGAKADGKGNVYVRAADHDGFIRCTDRFMVRSS